jgi:hypothetical protein
MPAADTQQGHVLTKHTTLSTTTPCVEARGGGGCAPPGNMLCPLCISTARHRTSTRAQASQPLLWHHWMSLQSIEAPTENVYSEFSDPELPCPPQARYTVSHGARRNQEGETDDAAT